MVWCNSFKQGMHNVIWKALGYIKVVSFDENGSMIKLEHNYVYIFIIQLIFLQQSFPIPCSATSHDIAWVFPWQPWIFYIIYPRMPIVLKGNSMNWRMIYNRSNDILAESKLICTRFNLYFIIHHSFLSLSIWDLHYDHACLTWNEILGWYTHTDYAGMHAGTVYLTESVQKFPQELVIPNDRIRVLDSIGQGGLCS